MASKHRAASNGPCSGDAEIPHLTNVQQDVKKTNLSCIFTSIGDYFRGFRAFSENTIFHLLALMTVLKNAFAILKPIKTDQGL